VTPSQSPTHRRYVVLAFLCVLSFLTYFDRVCIVRAQKLIQQDLAIEDDEMGLVLGAFWLAYALFEIPGGWMGDRYGPRRTLVRIVLAWSLFTVLSGSATGFASLLICRFLFGVGEAGAYPNMARVQANWLPARTRARAGGLLWLLARFGAAFSPLIFGSMLRLFDSEPVRDFLTDWSLDGVASWRFAFWVAGLAGVVWCIAFFPWFRDDPAQVPSVNAAELRLIREGGAVSAAHHSMPAEAWKALFRSSTLWAIACLYVCGSFGWSFFASWLPRYLKDVHQVEFEDSELMSGLPFLFGGIACLVGGTLSDFVVRRTRRKWLGRALFPFCGFGVAAVAMLCIPLTATPEEATLLLCVASAGHDFGQGANWATIVDVGGRYAGTAAGFINMVGNAGNYLQPVIGQFIFKYYGWNALMSVYAGMFLVAGSMWWLVNPGKTFYEDAPCPST
jgi:MFS family permease